MSIIDFQQEALAFHLRHIARLDQLQALQHWAHVDDDSTRMILEQAAAFASEVLTPLAASGDAEGCRLRDGCVALPAGSVEAYQQWCELGFPALGLPPEHDGLGFPLTILSAVQELCDGANLAFGMLGINLRCAAQALIHNGSADQVARWVPGLVSGALTSTIVISEPQAGSDVGRIRTTAQAQADGSWRLNGSKIWISYGDHDASGQILHLVLARMPDGEAGTRGLGLFAVTKYRDPARSSGASDNGIQILRIEQKMGLHASPTCVLDLQDAQGELIGEAGRGLQALFVMMNGMRLAVAVQGAAVANAATLHALHYALERPQGGHPLSPPVMIAEHADVRRMLLEMTAQAELQRALALRTAACLDRAAGDDTQPWRALGELLLPIAKTLNAEGAFAIASQGIQVLGGYGYTTDYPLERLARDVRVTAIYEGTSGIQALDFLKRKVLNDDGSLLRTLLALIATETTTGDSPYQAAARDLSALVEQSLAQVLAARDGAEDGAYAWLQLCGLLLQSWNGHSLYVAATADSTYQQRLRAALDYHAPTLATQAAAWVERAACRLPPVRLSLH